MTDHRFKADYTTYEGVDYETRNRALDVAFNARVANGTSTTIDKILFDAEKVAQYLTDGSLPDEEEL